MNGQWRTITIRDMRTSNPHTHTHTDTHVFLPVCAQNFVECTNSPSILYRSGTDYKREIVYNTITLSKYNPNTIHTHTGKQTNKQIINCQRTSPAEGYNKKLSLIYASVQTLFPARLALSLSHSRSSLILPRRLTTDWLSWSRHTLPQSPWPCLLSTTTATKPKAWE